MEKNKKEINLSWDVSNRGELTYMYLHVLNPLLRPGLSPKEILVLSEIMAEDKYEDDVIREKMLLDYSVKSKIINLLNITEAHLNNIISSLRKKNALIRTNNGNKLADMLDFRNVENSISLNFKFNVKSQE